MVSLRIWICTWFLGCEELLVDLVCTVTGGPCNYTGKGNPIPLTKEADFNAFVEDLEKSLDKNQVPVTTQNRLLRLLAPLSPAASE
ncbi:MAG: hypothetical protein M3160_09755 [Candidatus Eremiobacteraeota bacterium]|nr:hypothetical protein [Candidatus Eremiobacteraeota bacterium]